MTIVYNAVLNNGIRVELANYDNWNGGIWEWNIFIPLSPRELANFTAEEIQEIEKKLNTFTDRFFYSEVHRFSISVKGISNSLNLTLTNQGRAYSSNPAPLEYSGYYFRSQAEIQLFRALYEMGFIVMPLPVVAHKNPIHKRIEPDFVIIRLGKVFIIEVDGKTFHQENPATAQKRLQYLENEGARVIRVEAQDCLDNPQDTANYINERINWFIASR